MLRIAEIREVKLVDKNDVEFVEGMANKFAHSSDSESRNIGMAVLSVLERLGLKENAPEAATSKGNIKNNITALL